MEPVAEILEAVDRLVAKGDKVLVFGRNAAKHAAGLRRKGYEVDERDRHSVVEGEGGHVSLGISDECTYGAILGIDLPDGAEQMGELLRAFFRATKPCGRLLLWIGVSAVVGEPPVESQPQGGPRRWCEEDVRRIIDDAGFRVSSSAVVREADPHLLAVAIRPRYYSDTGGYKFMSADTTEDLKRVWRLRYEVYCLELGVEPENESGLMTDEWDDEYAVQLLALDESGTPVGIMRIVPNNPRGFQMEADFPLQEYMKAHGIVRAAETGRFVIRKGIASEARMMVLFGLYNLLSEFCRQTGTNDIFGITHVGMVEKYKMPWVRVIGEPFRYPPPSPDTLFVPIHSDFGQSYREYLERTAHDG
jgi:N-acyl-L-homoserine lactone synthetase